MSKFLSIIIISVLLFSSQAIDAGPATAQEREEVRALKHEQMQLRAKARLLRLKKVLNLQEDQMEAWSIYESKILEKSSQIMEMGGNLREKYADTGLRPNSLELAAANIARLEYKLAQAQDRLAIFTDFYQVLNDEQRATVDKLTLRKIRREAQRIRKSKQHHDREGRKEREGRQEG